MSYYLRPNPVNAPAIPGRMDREKDESFLQSLVNILRKPCETRCPCCQGSGLLSLRGICEQCMGRGQVLERSSTSGRY